MLTETADAGSASTNARAALANRSFLYGAASSCMVGQNIVYATLDAAALRPTIHLKPSVQNRDESTKSSRESVSCSSSSGEHEITKAAEEPKTKKKDKDKEDKRFAFAKNVLHYVPMQGRRYYRKSRKLASKSLSLKSLGQQLQPTQSQQTGKLKSRSLSRDELKYLSISQPSNFVHVASATRASVQSIAQANRQNLHENHDDLSPPQQAPLILHLDDAALWSSSTQPRPEDDYDDVGPPPASSSSVVQECKAERVASAELVELVEELVEELDEQDVYDDVGPAPAASLQPCDDELYDDVGPLREESPRESEEVVSPDEDVYDDVGPVPERLSESHERVNSLYGAPSILLDKDSEWEDLDSASLYEAQPPRRPLATRKGPRWACKIRRQRSKASRRSSARSRSRPTRTNSSLRHHDVAVSLGQGSVLLLGELPVNDPAVPARHDEAHTGDVKGLVQLRVILVDEGDQVQESSLYVQEDSSDDSNYETLQSQEPDDFSSESEAEVEPPAPSRPTPPPPREGSLGHSLGRRMKMLRRTWSITKGSLGRMRRRASADQQPLDHNDPRRYFGFGKHLVGSPTAPTAGKGLSTFYLDDGPSPETAGKQTSRREPIYANGNWYKEVGLYAGGEPASEPPLDSPISTPAVSDHYSVLAEEPLYQFYAAAATRVAFESDSDGYEEVEELTPTSATTELARPGHRTLWCQTPQVIGAGLLQRLSPDERKTQEAKFEILTSEASYLNSLRVLENEFASRHELVHELLTPAEREKLFGSVPDVLVTSERFLAELEGVWREDPMLAKLPELLLKHAEKCAHVYVEYCSNQVDVDATLKDLKAKKGYKFLETLSRIETEPACQSLSLHSFLMLPMQRITRLPLLADAVLSRLPSEHSERLGWERALASLSQVAAKCNEAARLAERRNEMEALARKLEYPGKMSPLELRGRELIRSGTVVQLTGRSEGEHKLTFGRKWQKRPLLLLLLTDHLLVGKLKCGSGEERYLVLESCRRSLVALEAAPEEGAFAGRHAMLLTLLENQVGRQVELVLSCESDTDRQRWLEAVSPPEPTCLGETLYESWDCPQVMALYSYAPRQPDEIALQPGDVINVLRKMNDGWLFGEKLLDGEQGWFPGNFTKEVASEHARARHLRQRHRLLALDGSPLHRKAKQALSLL